MASSPVPEFSACREDTNATQQQIRLGDADEQHTLFPITCIRIVSMGAITVFDSAPANAPASSLLMLRGRLMADFLSLLPAAARSEG